MSEPNSIRQTGPGDDLPAGSGQHTVSFEEENDLGGHAVEDWNGMY